MPPILETTSPKVARDEAGRILPGQQSLNPEGRPKGSSSIRDSIRQYLENNPEEMTKLVERFIKDNPAFMWQMMEGAPPKAVVIGNLDGSNIGAPSVEMLELANKINEIHATTGIGGDGVDAGALGPQA